jgi:5-aminolevulinate synthase
MDYQAYFADALAKLHDERRYRVFADIERHAGRFPHARWHSTRDTRDVVMWTRERIGDELVDVARQNRTR